MTAARRRLLLAAAGTLLWAVACLSPTLPLPPPSKPEIEGPNETGYVTLTGSVMAHSHVIATNARIDEGDLYITNETGRYVLELPAQVGDEVVLYYIHGNEISDYIVFQIPTPR
jgi:hypothetical protein